MARPYTLLRRPRPRLRSRQRRRKSGAPGFDIAALKAACSPRVGTVRERWERSLQRLYPQILKQAEAYMRPGRGLRIRWLRNRHDGLKEIDESIERMRMTGELT